MMRFLFLLLSVFLFVPAIAQKKEIRQARTDIKNRSNLENAESSMRNLLKDSVNRRNVKIYHTLADAVRAQYEAVNEKLYLKENTDTAAFFNTARKMFLAFESLVRLMTFWILTLIATASRCFQVTTSQRVTHCCRLPHFGRCFADISWLGPTAR